MFPLVTIPWVAFTLLSGKVGLIHELYRALSVALTSGKAEWS
jgi:hypothetical protein